MKSLPWLYDFRFHARTALEDLGLDPSGSRRRRPSPWITYVRQAPRADFDESLIGVLCRFEGAADGVGVIYVYAQMTGDRIGELSNPLGFRALTQGIMDQTFGMILGRSHASNQMLEIQVWQRLEG